MSTAGPYRITVSEVDRNGATIKERFHGDCDAYLLAVAKTLPSGELRVFTDHDGPTQQRQTLLKALTTHIQTIIGSRRAR